DLGRSRFLRTSVSEVLREALPITMGLGLSALVFALVLSIPLGVLAAVYPNTLIDRLALMIAVFGQSLPSFLVAFILVYIFGVQFRVLPVSGNETLRHFILPTIALGYYATPAIMRLTRSGMLATLSSDYVRM